MKAHSFYVLPEEYKPVRISLQCQHFKDVIQGPQEGNPLVTERTFRQKKETIKTRARREGSSTKCLKRKSRQGQVLQRKVK